MMKRIFGKREKAKEDVTVETLVVQKEEILAQLQEEEKRYVGARFQTARKSIHQSIAAVEKQEVTLRESQLSERRAEYEKITRENSEQQEKLQEQIRMMQMKLDEQRSLNIQNEQRMVSEIEDMNRQVEELKETLAKRIQEFGDPSVLLTGGLEGRPNRKVRAATESYRYSLNLKQESPPDRRKTMGSVSSLAPRDAVQNGWRKMEEDEEDSFESAKSDVVNTPRNPDDLLKPI